MAKPGLLNVAAVRAAPPGRAVVLAAGRGRRLRPATDDCPKPLLTLAGRPLLDYTLRALAAAGVREATIVTGYLAPQIEAYVGDGAAWGLAARFRRQPTRRGTADALRAATADLQGPSFVVAADYALADHSLLALKRHYRQSGAEIAVALKRLPPARLAAASSVRLGADGRLLTIVEKPAPGQAPSNLAASLLYIVPAAIAAFLPDAPLSPRGEYELPAVLNAMIAAGYVAVGLEQPAPPEWAG